MNVLIVYGTTDGQTRKIAEWTATHVRKLEHKVELRDSTSPGYDSDLVTFDAFIIAASVHQKRHQDTIINFAIAHHELLSARPSAFISVSLSAVLEDERKEAQKYVDHFVSVTGWQPRMTSPSRGCFALHRVRLLPRADRKIHRHEARWRCEHRARSRIH